MHHATDPATVRTTDRTTDRPRFTARPPLGWIKRRARRLERFYQVERRIAIWDAALDYVTFFHPHLVPVTPVTKGPTRLIVIQGGR
jgi:hypothetical protein